MGNITIPLSDERWQRLSDLARQAKTTPEDLVRATVEEWLSPPASKDFQQAASYVLKKNQELYRRLT